jgi:secreted Zn-dependent insulinase-like peptidase
MVFNHHFQLEDDKVHQMLIAFKNRHYSASSMTLAIQSQHELDELQAWVEESFSQIPESDSPRQTFHHLKDPFNTKGKEKR